jgi:hypothetical protein
MSEFRALSRRPSREPDVPQGSLRREADGFLVQAKTGGAPARVRWDEIIEVRAFKMDLISRDLVCLSISAGKGGVASRSIQLHEEMPGWYTLLEELQANLPGCRTDWWAEVAFPAFATNERVIFRRESRRAA